MVPIRKIFIMGIYWVTLLILSPVVLSENAAVGKTLNNKVELDIKEIPKEVMAEIRAARFDVSITGAEKEIKHGDTYIDVEAEDQSGNEVEFDMLLTKKGWRIVEIQRDVNLAQTPEAVRNRLSTQLPKAHPARIIESDQGDGNIIYEFFFVSAQGKETKQEVKFSNGKAELLAKEWAH